MRFAIRLLVPLTTVALVACGAEPVPVGQRFPTAAEAPGTKPDPVEERQTTKDFDEFLVALTPALIDPDREEMTTVFQEAGFKGAGVDVRFFGERILSSRHISSVGSSSLTLKTRRGAHLTGLKRIR
jgi:hypothetical protein